MHPIFRCLALAAATTLAACGGGALSTNEGHLRLVNASGSLGTLDLFADNDAVATGVAPFTASGYEDLKADTYSLDVRQSGTPGTLVTVSTTLPKKDHQTVVAYTSGGTTAATVLSDEEGDPRSGKAKLRVFHTAAADAGNVDIYLVAGACSDLATSAAAPVASNVSGLQTAYTELASSATAYHVCVTTAGDKSDLRLELPSLVLGEKRIVTLILARGAGGFLLNAMVVDQQGAAAQALNTLARARVATSASLPVTVDVNGTTIASGLTAPNVGPYVTVPAGADTVEVNGSPVTPAATTPDSARTAPPGADITVLLTGSTPTLNILPDDNTASVSTAKPAKIRLVNGLNGTSGTATLTLDNVVVGSGAAPGQASAPTQVAASAGLARLEARIGTLQFYFNQTATLESGRVYSLFLLGDGTVSSPSTGILVPDR
jgi:hypothetical protein